jgi:hypothetical protein
MSKGLKKYRRSLSGLFLVSYLFLISLTVFHHHHVSIQNGDLNFVNTTGSAQDSPFDKLIDLTHDCTILQFAYTVIDYSFTSVYSSTETPNEQPLTFSKERKILFKPLLRKNSLRAPPISA